MRFVTKLLSRLKTYRIYLLAPICPVLCSKFLYWRELGRRLDLRHPATLDEKLMWLKLNTYRNNELVTRCADKFAVRGYVQEAGCGEILNELYGAWENPEDIDWDALPEKFAMKCNHASGFNIICSDKSKLDVPKCKKQMKRWMNRDFWRFSAEMQYRGIPKRIVVERFLGAETAPADYKFYCFHGEPVCVLVCREREKGWPHFYFFDCQWNFMPITKDGLKENSDFSLPMPERFFDMVEYARKLSKPFPFVRVDLYDEAGKIVFGELTFTPSACMDTERLPETDELLGRLLEIET